MTGPGSIVWLRPDLLDFPDPETALAEPNVQKFIDGKTIRKVVVVPDKLDEESERLLRELAAHRGDEALQDLADLPLERYAHTLLLSTIWRYRDWVIEAFNADLPFDEFTIKQLAGDLMEDAGYEQKLATGFNRNHAITQEGGVISDQVSLASQPQ